MYSTTMVTAAWDLYLSPRLPPIKLIHMSKKTEISPAHDRGDCNTYRKATARVTTMAIENINKMEIPFSILEIP